MGASKETLLDMYKLFCRSVLEFSAPVWTGALSKKNKNDIERVQRNALRIIEGSADVCYEDALEKNSLDDLSTRRDKLCLNFAEKCVKSGKFSDWFSKGMSTRSGTQYFAETEARTKRFATSAIPYLTKLMNKNSSAK